MLKKVIYIFGTMLLFYTLFYFMYINNIDLHLLHILYIEG